MIAITPRLVLSIAAIAAVVALGGTIYLKGRADHAEAIAIKVGRLPMRRLLLAGACALATIPAGCGTNRPASVGSECSVFGPPAAVVRGADPVSQRWIDETVESGVVACGWGRPV